MTLVKKASGDCHRIRFALPAVQSIPIRVILRGGNIGSDWTASSAIDEEEEEENKKRERRRKKRRKEDTCSNTQ